MSIFTQIMGSQKNKAISSPQKNKAISSPQKKKAISSPQKKKAISSPQKKKAILSPQKKKAISSSQKKKASSKDANNQLATPTQKKQAALEAQKNLTGSVNQNLKVDTCPKKNPSESSHSKKIQSIEADNIETSSSTAKRKRGINTMQRIVKRKLQGMRKVVEYNKKGQPHGKTAKEMQSYIGVLARTKVRIDIKKWKFVELDTKKKILEAIEMAFVIAPQSRKMVLSSAARKWREFKSRLTNTYVYSFEDEELLCAPPEEYPFIDPDAWRAFVAHRFTEEFRELHKKQQERRAQNQYNHRLSRKGYVGLEDELLEKMAEDDIDRATLWRKGREDKDGNIIDEKTAEKAKEIDEVKKKVAEGSLTVIGSNDILTMALGTSERHGRVRGVGGYVTPSFYFNQPRRQREYVNESIQETVKKILEEERDKWQALVAKLVAEERDFWVQKIVQIEAKIDGKCKAPGEAIPTVNLTPPRLNGAHVSNKASCSIVKIYDKSDDKEDAYNGENKDNEDKKMPPLKKHGECLKFEKASNESHNLHPMPSSLKVLCGYAKNTLQLKGETVNFVMEEEVFGLPRPTHILYEDILQFGAMSEISGTCIVMYMRYLYDVLKKTQMLRMITFVDPARVGAKGCGSFSQKARYMASQFSRAHPGTIFLIPYNSGGHWVLTIVNLDNKNVYFMDSLKQGMIDEEWKQVVNTAIKAYNGQSSKQIRKSPQWIILVGTPVQPTYTECGYFVMRFMKEIVEDGSLDFVAKWNKENGLTYTQEQIDEVRGEWATYVSSYM